MSGIIGRTCPECGDHFWTNRIDCHYCSDDCRNGNASAMETRIRELLSEVYLPEGVDIWLAATHKAGPLKGRCPNNMIAAGATAPVLAAVEILVGGAFA